MLEVDRMETATTEVTSIWRRNDIENSTWRTHRYFVDFESRIHVEIPRRIESSNPPYQITNCFSMSYDSSICNLISRKENKRGGPTFLEAFQKKGSVLKNRCSKSCKVKFVDKVLEEYLWDSLFIFSKFAGFKINSFIGIFQGFWLQFHKTYFRITFIT